MGIVRKINSSYNQVKPNLDVLRQEGIITEEHYGNIRMFRLNRESTKTKLVIEALKILDS